jgi:hypothetical protein
MTKTTAEQAGRYVLDGSDEDLRRLLSMSADTAAAGPPSAGWRSRCCS